MTRLSEAVIADIGSCLRYYNKELMDKTGYSLFEIACLAANTTKGAVLELVYNTKAAIVPITAGRGIIQGFSQTIKDIVTYLGTEAFVTKGFDIGGLAEGIELGADLIFLADDTRFIAINISKKRVVDNAEATARGYVAALKCMVKNLNNLEILVLGAGRVGYRAILTLIEHGARVTVYDCDKNKLSFLQGREGIAIENNLVEALYRYRIIFDASPAKDIITEEHIQTDTLVIAPGVPIALTPKACEKIGKRIIHDPLQIGVATMLLLAITP